MDDNEEKRPDDLAVLTGTVLPVAAALKELIAALPMDSPARTKLRAAREQQLRAIREREPTGPLLFAAERAWASLLSE